MSDFLAAYPDYATTSRLDDLRASEYSYLDAGGHTYLDYTGAGLAADAQLRAHAKRLRGGCFGNPHSESPASSASTQLIEQARAAVLGYFNASAAEYAVIFTPNATGACRLVGEAYPFRRMSRLVLTADNHNSVNGMREFARARGAATRYIRLSPADLRVAGEDVTAALGRGSSQPGGGGRRRRGLFAYPAQSNFSGVQHPLGWVDLAQAAGYDVLLDAAAFVPANRLDLGAVQPEFVTVSFYKMFGYPTGLGCLLARRDALARLRRPWFSGGTIVGRQRAGRLAPAARRRERVRGRHAQLPRHPRRHHRPGLDQRHRHRPDPPAGRLPDRLAARLPGRAEARQRRADGAAVRPAGRPGARRRPWRSTSSIPAAPWWTSAPWRGTPSAAGISVRTGCFCNPGAGEWAFGLTRRQVAPLARVPAGATCRPWTTTWS